jgi:hypothetical protein
MTASTPCIEKECALPETAFSRDLGSFRDPHGFVVHGEGRIFRVLTAQAQAHFKAAECARLIRELTDAGLLAPTWRLTAEDSAAAGLRAAFPEGAAFLEQRRIEFPTYPSEWTFAMIADAALLTLDIQERCARKGFTLQDASAYNVFFDGARPLFIDVTSIEPAGRADIWLALGQFQRLFLYPLMLAFHRRMSTKAYYLAHMDGVGADEVRSMAGRLRGLTPGFLLDVTLPALLGRSQRLVEGRASSFNAARRGDPEVQCMTLGRLRRKIVKLRERYTKTSCWSGYETHNSYTIEAERYKAAYIEAFMRQHAPARVTDLGCNTGRYSRIAAQSGARVVAVDSDHECVDRLYRALRAAHEPGAYIDPVWTSVDNPTPAIGFANRERPSFLARHSADAVFALALVHHLLVSARLTLPLLVRHFAELTQRWLVIEYVAPVDPMFRRLGAFREDLYRDLSAARFLEALAERFAKVDELALPGGTRTLYTLAKK